jgi:serine/threonine-protein kinase RsbW
MRISDTISVLIPLEAEYVSIVRLAASGIANNIGFDFDSIEDIKVAISEVLNKIIEKRQSEKRITIDFMFIEDGITITFKLLDQDIPNIFGSDDDGFALAIISSLMDEADFNKNDHIIMTMTKKLGKAV